MTRVLIVDDQPGFRRRLSQLLVHAGLTVIGEAGDIPAAGCIVQELKPDLAVVDIELPGMNGLAGARLLKTLDPALRVILISAYRDRAELFRMAAQQAGAEDFIPKDELDLQVVLAWARPVK